MKRKLRAALSILTLLALMLAAVPLASAAPSTAGCKNHRTASICGASGLSRHGASGRAAIGISADIAQRKNLSRPRPRWGITGANGR